MEAYAHSVPEAAGVRFPAARSALRTSGHGRLLPDEPALPVTTLTGRTPTTAIEQSELHETAHQIVA
jgi:hypothetical protein